MLVRARVMGGGLGFGLGLEVGSAYNIGQTRTQPKSGMEIKKNML